MPNIIFNELNIDPGTPAVAINKMLEALNSSPNRVDHPIDYSHPDY